MYDKKLSDVIWNRLKDEEKKKFKGLAADEVPGFAQNKELYQ